MGFTWLVRVVYQVFNDILYQTASDTAIIIRMCAEMSYFGKQDMNVQWNRKYCVIVTIMSHHCVYK